MRSPQVVFIAWTQRKGRARDIASAVGGIPKCIYPPGLGTPKRALLRYVLSAVQTIVFLKRTRPNAMIVTAPPVLAPAVAWLYAWATGIPFVLDSHPTAFGAKSNVVSRRLAWLHRFVIRRAAGVLVTTVTWQRLVESWGGKALILHEAPADWEMLLPPDNARPVVLFAGIFASDEPIEEVLGAARALPDVDFLVTGDPTRCPEHLISNLPENVELTGYLDADRYRKAVAGSDVILALTTEPTSVMRAAYEAIYAGRILVTSNVPPARELYDGAIIVDNDARSIAAGIRTAIDERHPRQAMLANARHNQLRRWEAQLSELGKLLDLAVHP